MQFLIGVASGFMVVVSAVACAVLLRAVLDDSTNKWSRLWKKRSLLLSVGLPLAAYIMLTNPEPPGNWRGPAIVFALAYIYLMFWREVMKARRKVRQVLDEQ